MPHEEPNQNRRCFLQTIGISGFIVLAGCSGSEDKASTDDDTTSATEGSDTEGGTASEDTTTTDQPEDDSESDQESKNEDDDEESAEETYRLTITLLDSTTESPTEGTVYVDGREVDSRAEGEPTQATVDLPPGEYAVTGDTDERPPKWTGEVQTVQLYDDISVDLRLYEPDERKTIIVRSAGGVEVTMKRTDDGATATRMIEKGLFEGLSVTGETRDGSVIFEAYPGRYTITGEDVHGNVQEETVVVHQGGTIELDELEPPAESTDPIKQVTFTVTNIGDNETVPPPVSGMIVKGKRIPDPRDLPEERVSEDLGVEFETDPTDENGKTTAQLRDDERYTAWAEDEDGQYYEPYSFNGDTRTTHRSFDVEGETEVEIILRF